MTLPEHLERLNQISIDTLGLSESTSALLKWFNFMSVLDCIMYFSEAAHYTYHEIIDPWPRLFLVLFDEVKPKMIAAGSWDLVMDTELERTLGEYKWHILHQKGDKRVVSWQGKDQDLNNIPFEQLGLSDLPLQRSHRLASVGDCIAYFLYRLGEDPKYRLEIGLSYKNFDREAEPGREFQAYMFRVAQPRLVELGYWRFVEEYIDDVIEEGRFSGDFDWEDEDRADDDEEM